MRPVLLLFHFIPWLAILASCSSPPKPPSVDESRKRPANTATAVELQSCRSELQNARLRAIDVGRIAARATEAGATATTSDATAWMQQDIAALRRVAATLQRHAEPVPQPNGIVTVRFDYGSTRVDIEPETVRMLLEDAKTAPLVLLRGRTDGIDDAPAEGRIARARAAAVADYLIAAGVSPSRIRSTYQPTGDHAAENRSAQGRALNRRVEIEIYRALPVALSAEVPRDITTH